MWKRNCPNCGKELMYSTNGNFKTAIKLNSNCRSCAYKSKIPLVDRFWSKIHKTDLCWNFTGYCDRYGIFWITPKKSEKAHRYSWQIHYGEIPIGMDVLHHCDNPPCVRPDHLFLGTHTDNMHDMINKNRHRASKGEKHGMSKLKNEDVAFIKQSSLKSKELSKKFCVTGTMIYYIRSGKNWKHII